MNERVRKLQNRSQRSHRVRAKVSGTTERPRLCIRITNTHITVQIINDELGKTLASVTSVGRKEKGTLTEKAVTLGIEIAKKAKTAKVNKVVLDRGSRLYHGRVKAFAEAARAEGLEF